MIALGETGRQQPGSGDNPKIIEEQVKTCAHCGAENPPGLLLCMTCGRDPTSGRDLFAAPEVPFPAEAPAPWLVSPSFELTISLPDPIQVPDPLPIPSVEDFAALPPQPPLVPPPVYRAAPPEPKALAPVLSPGPRWTVGLVGLVVLMALGLGAAASLATLNLPGGLCLGGLWLVLVIPWLAIMSARRGETRSTATGARRQLVISLGQRLFESTPSATKEQLAKLPVKQVPPLTQPASHLIYLSSTGGRAGQLTQVLLGTLCALVAGDHVGLATQTYDVLTASPFRQSQDTVQRTAVFPRTLYVGTGYLEKIVLKQMRRTNTPTARELVADVLHQAGADLLERIAADVGGDSAAQDAQAPDLDTQMTALREFCEELKALNPELYEQLVGDVEEAVQSFVRDLRQGSG
jgi:hypothetical protein